MEIHIKKAVKAGNSSAVILPRSWLDREVRIELIEKTPEKILIDTLEIIKKHLNVDKIIGIYLVGSHARGDYDKDSDIDILVVTDDTDKEMISEGVYNILIVSSELLSQKLSQDLFPIGQMIREAKPLLNSSYLKSVNVKVTRKNISWYIDTTEDKLRLIKRAMDLSIKKNNYLSDLVAYTLILRIRTLYIIERLIKNQDYSKKEFLKLIGKVSHTPNPYERYLAVKNNLEITDGLSIEEAERLYDYLKSQLARIQKMI
ncbi:MAG: nucleotidyltransferase domain-containing protein [Nanoarchaeota archaeon]